MLTANALAQYDASSSRHLQADVSTEKTRPTTTAATNTTTALPVAVESAAETVKLSDAARALQRGEAAGTSSALTYSNLKNTRLQSEGAKNNRAQQSKAMPADIAHRKLADKLQAAGIATEPPFDYKFDASSQHIQVLGNRPDAARIEQLINSDPTLQQSLRGVTLPASNSTTAPTSKTAGNTYLNLTSPARQKTVLETV